MRRLLLPAALLVLPVAACGGSGRPAGQAIPIVVSAPVSSEPWVGSSTVDGVQLAVDEVNAKGGVTVGGAKHPLQVQVRANGGSAQTAVQIARDAVAEHALAIVTDGTGAPAVAQVTDPASLPVFVTFDGGASLVDAQTRPTVFRIAPADAAMSRRLADYVAGRHPRVALFTEQSAYGDDGRSALTQDLRTDEVPVVSDQVLPVTAADVSAQVAAARAAGATALVLWLHAPGIAAVVRAARQSGWAPAVYTSPEGEDPAVRQLLADHLSWTDGLTFVAGRITSETGPAPFEAFRAAYEKRFGVVDVVDGITSPPDYAMYSHDAALLVAQAATNADGLGPALLTSLGLTTVTGANGDERGFLPTVREGVVPDDMYFATFSGGRFRPVTDDVVGPPNLPYVPQ